MKCEICGNENPADCSFCENCGGKLEAQPLDIGSGQLICPSCGANNPPGNDFCESCGSNLSSQPPTAQAQIECPSCGRMNPPEELYCIGCSVNLKTAQRQTPTPSIMGILTGSDGNEIKITKNETLGRAELSRFVSPDKTTLISRQHFTISLDGNNFYIEDDDSTNGTMLNSVEIKDMGRQELKDGDEIKVSDEFTLKFSIS